MRIRRSGTSIDCLVEEEPVADTLVGCMRAWLALETYAERKAYIAEHREIISATCLAWLEIRVLNYGADRDRFLFFGLHARMLDRVRTVGINEAFEGYIGQSPLWDTFARRRLLTSQEHPSQLDLLPFARLRLQSVLLIGEGISEGFREAIAASLKKLCLLAEELDTGVALAVLLDSDAGTEHSEAATLVRNALRSGSPVLPVLVDGTKLSDLSGIWNDTPDIWGRQAVEISSAATPQIAASLILRGLREIRETPSDQPDEIVFISYRRADSQPWATGLAQVLRSRMGAELVFLDTARVRPARPFEARIEKAVSRCSDFIAVIGKRYLQANSKGVRRIDDPDDLLRHEIRTALSLGKRMHVVLVDGGCLPGACELPDDLKRLASQESVLRAASTQDLKHIADRVLAGRFPDASRIGKHFEHPDRERAARSAAASVIAELAELGWTVIERRSDLRWKDCAMHSPEHPQFRFFVTKEQLLLQEKGRGFPVLESRGWITRSVWRHDPSTLHLPDDIVAAATNPRGSFE